MINTILGGGGGCGSCGVFDGGDCKCGGGGGGCGSC